MEEPSSLIVAYRISVFILLGLVLPQSLGFIGHIYAAKRKLILKILAILIAPTTYFVISSIFWKTSAAAIREGGHYVCGAFGAAAIVSILLGTVIHLIVAIVFSVIIYYVWKKKSNAIAHDINHNE